MTSPFDTELNTAFHENVLDSSTMAASTMLGGGAVATVVDIGASLWNSLPLTENVDTADLLSRISTDALQVYQEHPDAIHTASFVGGMFLPMGVATKGMGLMRAGVKGSSWFGNADRAADLAKIGEAISETKSYRDLARGIYAKTAVNQALDAVAMEMAFVGTMNAHPFMEDYMKDLGTNFTISAMLGGSLGAGVGIIADRFAIKAAAGEAVGTAWNSVKSAVEAARPDMTNSLKMQAQETSIKNLAEMIEQRKALGKTDSNDLLYAIAGTVQRNIKADQARMFESMISDDIKALPNEQKDAFMRMLIDKPEMLGVENVRLLTAKEVTAKGLIKAPKFDLHAAPDFQQVSSMKMMGPLQPKAQKAVFFPELGLYGTLDDTIHYAEANVFKKSAEQMAKELPYNYGKIPNYDSSLELLSRSSAEVQKEYIAAWDRIKKMSPKDFGKLHIGEGDAPLINAALWRMATDPEVAGVQIRVSNNLPIMKQIVKEHVEKMVQEGKMTAEEVAAAGPDAVYYAKMEKLGNDINADRFMPKDYSASARIQRWIGGDKMDWNKAALDHLAAQTPHGFAKSGMDASAAKWFDTVYNSPESKELRNRFSQMADAEGNVYLYRGWQTNDIKGAQTLDSYTTSYKKAAEFTRHNPDKSRAIKLYKIPVDDIVAGFKDIGGDMSAEVIVRASARPIVAELSTTGKMALQKAGQVVKVNDGLITTTKTTITKETVEEGVQMMGPQELSELFTASKQEAIDTLLAGGMPIHSIAIKTNTDLGVVKAYAMTKQSLSLNDFIPPNVSPLTALNKIKRYDDIEKVLSPTGQPLVLSTNNIKNPLYIQRNVALNNKEARMLNKEFTALTMFAARSSTVRELADVFYHPEGLGKALDVIETKIGLMNNELAGSAFFNSFDFFTRNMKDVGPAVSSIGKAVERTAKLAIDRVMKPIENAMVAVQKDPAALVEFSTFYNVNAGLKGWRGVNKEGFLVQKAEKLDEAGKKVIVLEPVKYQGQDYKVVTPSVRSLIKEMQAQSGELRELSNTINKVKGSPNISDIGLWIPSFNPIDKHIAYVHDLRDGTTKLLWAKTEAEFKTMLQAYKERVSEVGLSKELRIITKDEQADFNLLNGRLDPVNMERADLNMQKAGASAAAIVKPDLALFGEIAKGYEFYITSQVRNLADLNMHEVTDTLQKMSQYNRRFFDNQPFSEVKKAVAKPKDAAAIMRNTLLGTNNLGEYAGWQWTNKSFETGIAMMSNAFASVWNETVKPITRTFFGGTKDIEIAGVKKIDFKAFNEELEKRGIIYPWKGCDEAVAKKLGFFSIENSPDVSKRIIYASNALAATMALRFAELAQPLVNAMSLPILTGLAIGQKMPETFMGVKQATTKVWPTQIMYEGVRAMHDVKFKALNKRWEDAGYFTPMVSEASDIMRATRRFDKGAIAKVENALDSQFVTMMSKPADYAESLTRKIAMNTGAQLAKRLYPELDDVGITIFARDFMDKAIGNFHASQRPVMYQGTLGVALGLFQTYMWTMGQSVYRHLELKQYKELGKAALSQSALFGTQSLPGFEQVSHAIGDNFSDNNIDLVTGTYRATGDTAADFILYGLPSNLGATVSTRGDISPRLPNVLAGFDNTVAVNFASQAMTMLGSIKDAMKADNPEMARSLAQALSLQSMSRPIARTAELATGYSITGQGNTVQVPEEVWTFQGVAARVLATRPIEEQKLRDADHLNHFYGALDRERRQEAMNEIRTAIRNGSLSEQRIAKTAESYFRHGGSPQGWRSAVNEAIGRTDAPGRDVFINKLKPDNPINFMINNLEN